LSEKFGYDLSGYKISNKRQVLRNCVEPRTGREILDVVEKVFAVADD
jgi:DNA (cytosine-5)-methyltransferase 1